MKRNTIYKLCITGLMAVCLSLPMSCAKFDQEPQGEWKDGDQNSISGSIEAKIFTMYAKIRGFNITSGNVALAIHSFRSEDAEKGSTASDGAEHGRMYDNFQYTSTNSIISGYYSSHYELIHLSNTAIKEINEIEESKRTESDKVNFAEAHFFRAFAYFNLVRAFGEVPLIDFAINNQDEANIPKSSVEDIYKLIDKDLTIAEEGLPRTWPAAYVGRLTWGAARSLHAKTYLMRSDFQSAYTASIEVIQSGLYNLNTPFEQIFRESGENSSESIFEIQCTANETYKASNEVGSQFAEVQGVRGPGEWNLGWGWNTPTQELADAFEAGDPRKNETLLYFVKSESQLGTIQPNTPYNERPIANSDVANKYYNKKAYTNPELRKKFAKNGFWFNIRIIRYADVVLMAAEAANEIGNAGEALTYLEMIRARARGSNSNVLPRITTAAQSELREAIHHERRVELAMEFDRFYDLVRWGEASAVLGSLGYQPKHRYLPLPNSQVTDSNGVLKQNPDYN